MSYSFGKPKPAVPQTIVGHIPATDVVLSLMTRIKIVVHVPDDFAVVGEDHPPDFEPKLRATIASSILGSESVGYVVLSVAVEQFEDAGR